MTPICFLSAPAKISASAFERFRRVCYRQVFPESNKQVETVVTATLFDCLYDSRRPLCFIVGQEHQLIIEHV